MHNTLRRASGLVILAAITLFAAPAVLAGEARVTLADGLVSARFDATPIADAVDAIRRAAKLDVVLPASVRDKTVTLAVDQLPVERFIRRVLDLLDVGGYALIYEASGETRRIIVVESARPQASGPSSDVALAPTVRAPEAVSPPSPRQPLGAPPAHVMPLVRVDPTGIRITPRGPYDRMNLTVSGRNGQVRREFPSGSQAYFDVLDEQGKPLGDGSYNYEVVVVPAVPAEIRERMQAVAESGDERMRLERELREQGWIPKEPLVHSGHFSVTGGMIVDGSAQEEPRRRP